MTPLFWQGLDYGTTETEAFSVSIDIFCLIGKVVQCTYYIILLDSIEKKKVYLP
jgi:hypothetical protein